MGTQALSLYEIEDDLQAMIETVEGGIDAEQEVAFFNDLSKKLIAAIEKRDRVGHFLAHCEAQEALVDKEMDRLSTLKKVFTKARERMEGYVIMTIRQLGVDPKGKWKKLEGKTTVFSLRQKPGRVAILDEAELAMKFKNVSVTIPGAVWAEFTEQHPDEAAELVRGFTRQDVAPDKRAIKAAIDAGEDVDGADVVIGDLGLIRK